MQKQFTLLLFLANFTAISAQKTEFHFNMLAGQGYDRYQYGESFSIIKNESHTDYAFGGNIQAFFPLVNQLYLGGEIGFNTVKGYVKNQLTSNSGANEYLFYARYMHRQVFVSVLPEYRYGKSQFLYAYAGPTFIIDLKSRFEQDAIMLNLGTGDDLIYTKEQYSAPLNLAFSAGLGLRARITENFLLKGGLRFLSSGISQWNKNLFSFHFGTINYEMGCVLKW